MRKICTTITALLLILSLSFAQTIDTVYVYPITPTTVDWKQFKSRSEMAEVLQIPDTILKKLSTKALVSTCMNFPMFMDLYFFNDIQTGVNSLKQSFNGFAELLKRPDAGKELLAAYKLMNPENFEKNGNEIYKGDFTFRFVQIEILLAQDEIIKNIAAGIEKELLTEAALKYDTKKATGIFSGFALSPSALIIARLLNKNSQIPRFENPLTANMVNRFIITGTAYTPEVLVQIRELLKNK